MKLKSKLAFVIIIISVMTLFLLGIMEFTIGRYNNNLEEMLKLTAIANRAMSNLSYMNSFWETKNLEDLKDNRARFEKIKSDLTSLVEHEKNKELKGQLELLFENFIKSSKISFASTNYEKQLGLSENEGLRGNLREAIHNVEQTIEQFQDYKLLSQMLTLRRWEKDFIIRKDDKSIQKWENDYKTMVQWVNESVYENQIKIR